MRTVKQILTTFLAMLREIFDESAYKRYLEKFDRQETQIENYQEQIKKLQAQEHSQRKALEDFLASFTAD